jgi:8-oxo-dGTP pyrophosphatase MutT (NUDIX family)
VSEPTSALPPKRPSPQPPPSPEPASPTDRAVRALADAVGESRPRVAHDGTDPDIPVAATVMLLRDGAAGPEVLMIERPDRGSFAGAWVFPGGKLDDGDRTAGDEPEEDAARRAGVRETREETGLSLDSADLLTVSVWDPPPGLPLRIRTWFFAASGSEGELALSAHEAVAAEWVRPEVVLERHGRGEVTLYPPTWVTLHDLSGQPDLDALLGMLRLTGLRRFETVARRSDSGPVLLWEGDAEYADAEYGDAEHGDAEDDRAAAGAASGRHRLELGALPWVYTRSE